MTPADKRIETLRPAPARGASEEPATPQTWLGRFQASIVNLPSDTKRVLELDAKYVASKLFPMSESQLDTSSFGADRVRTGIVVGSVQSGKTASMLAVSALLLDSGVELLVILAGTRVPLWLQTYERLLNQLDGSDVWNHWKRSSERVLLPQPEDILFNHRVDPRQYLQSARRRVMGALSSKIPVICVVPKEDDHLLALARFLGERLDEAASKGLFLRMAVLDDEADDASVLDSREVGKVTPKFIQMLWASTESAPATRHEGLFASYAAYTATPQANYLQRSHNPLAPRDFHASLRTPADVGEISPRTLSFTEGRGLNSFYSGGDFFYERFRGLPGDMSIAYAYPKQGDDHAQHQKDFQALRWRMIGDALRAFMVAGALRLLVTGTRLSGLGEFHSSREELLKLLPPTHSMLFHPSFLKEAHFAGADDIIRWTKATPGFEAEVEEPLLAGGDRTALDSESLGARLDLEEDLWSIWLDDYKKSTGILATLPGFASAQLGSISWPEVRKVLLSDVFPGIRVRVLNSDPKADDRPEFAPVQDDAADGRWRRPRDIFTIFVAGNVLSRGLTVEGLTTSLFMRDSGEPIADTQMQMQRWFGYRGPYLHFCRLLTFSDQLELFRQYHRNDCALKSEILGHMDGHPPPFLDGVLVLQGSGHRATAKVDSRRVPLHPGPTPSVRLVEPESGRLYQDNIASTQRLLDSDLGWRPMEYPEGSIRGLIGAVPISLESVAEYLDSLRYSAHDPDPTLEVNARWAHLQRSLRLSQPLFRPPGKAPGAMVVDPAGCPYSIAAYIRLWCLALERHDIPGMQPTDSPTTPWSMLNLSSYRESKPAFYVGVRFGSERKTSHLRFQGEPIPMMRRGFVESRQDLVETLWGSRNPSDRWRGDQAFDYHLHGVERAPELLRDGAWRRRGEPGLLLIHPILDSCGKSEVVAVGLALPHGGPDHVAALKVALNGANDV